MLTYLQVHLVYTLPPTILLLLLHWPLRTRWDTFKTCLLTAIAVASATPWDAYIISQGAWNYRHGSVLGTVWGIPLEEYAFFIIQTTFTSTLYSLLSRPLLPALSIPTLPPTPFISSAAFFLLSSVALIPSDDPHLFYFRALLYWATPFLLLLFFTSGRFALATGRWKTTIASIAISTGYLSWVDWLAMRDGVWWIEDAVLTGWRAWPGMPAEELLFFCITNTLIVFGLTACDNMQALFSLYPRIAFPDSSPPPTALPMSPPPLKPLYWSILSWPEQTKTDLEAAVKILERKSRSFWVASAAFPAPVRQDLIILYAFARQTDDLIDLPPTDKSALSREAIIEMIEAYLDFIFGLPHDSSPSSEPYTTSLPPLSALAGIFPLPNPSHRPKPSEINQYLSSHVPSHVHSSFRLLSQITHRIPRYPFSELLRGYSNDLKFSSVGQIEPVMQNKVDLLDYALCVAGSVAELIVYAGWSAYPDQVPLKLNGRREVLDRAREMGISLQLVNIARDLAEDARDGRCYIPQTWFSGEEALPSPSPLVSASQLQQKKPSPLHFLTLSSSPNEFPWETYSLPLIILAESFSSTARPAIGMLPVELRPGARAACGGYLLIGEEIKHVWKGNVGERRRVPSWKRVLRVLKEVYLG